MGQCLSPFRKKGELIDLPCGKCYECRQRRMAGWAYRLSKEAEVSTSAFFLTLTYDDDHLPLNNSINKRDLQLFMKRLRKLNKEKITYYSVGEYGGRTMRPHYHSIIFNVDIETIDMAWTAGTIYIGTLTPASIAYTLKYISKSGKIKKGDPREKEFSLMSKGIGKNYLTPQIIAYHRSEVAFKERAFLTSKGGFKTSMPRYYKEKIYTEKQKKSIQKHLERMECEKYVNKTYQQIGEIMMQDEYIRIAKANKKVLRYESI
jgi:hypothetical protein